MVAKRQQYLRGCNSLREVGVGDCFEAEALDLTSIPLEK